MLPDFVQGKLRPIIHKHPGLPVLLFFVIIVTITNIFVSTDFHSREYDVWSVCN